MNDWGMAVDAGVILLVVAADGFKVSISLLVLGDGIKVQGGGIFGCLNLKDVINKVEFVGRLIRNWMAAEKISNNIAAAQKVDDLWAIFLNNQPPAANTVWS